jgi:uncharacterized protein (DUF1499 family)
LFVRPANPISHRLARLALLLGCVSALVVGSAGPLARYGGLEPYVVIAVFRYGAYIAFAAIALAIATIVPSRPGGRRRGFLSAVMALVVGVGAAWMPVNFLLRANQAPRINDITTDTANPPPFVVTLQLRRGASTPAVYEGERVARLQHEGYPDIAPVLLRLPPDEAFRRVDRVAMGMGWEVVARAPQDGRLEAVVTSDWFGFRDDVVVRIRPEGDGTRVDVRSKSRVGQSDLGVNARRVRAFLSALKAESQPAQ